MDSYIIAQENVVSIVVALVSLKPRCITAAGERRQLALFSMLQELSYLTGLLAVKKLQGPEKAMKFYDEAMETHFAGLKVITMYLLYVWGISVCFRKHSSIRISMCLLAVIICPSSVYF